MCSHTVSAAQAAVKHTDIAQNVRFPTPNARKLSKRVKGKLQAFPRWWKPREYVNAYEFLNYLWILSSITSFSRSVTFLIQKNLDHPNAQT